MKSFRDATAAIATASDPTRDGDVPVSHCRSGKCKAEILFIRTKNGKHMPVDAKPCSAAAFKMGQGLFDLDGTYWTVDHSKGPDKRVGYLCHYATCPEGPRFRKLKKKAAPKPRQTSLAVVPAVEVEDGDAPW